MVVRELITMLGFQVDTSKLKAFDASIETLKKNIFSLQSLAAAGAAATLYTLVNGARRYGDELAVTAEKMGITSTELQKLNYIALQTDVNSSALQTSFTFLSRTLGQAALGSTQAQKTFAALGLTAKDIEGKSPNEVFQKTITLLSGMDDVNKRNALSMRVFGRGYREIIPLLSKSPKDFEAIVLQMSKLGFQSEETTKKQADFDDTMNMMEASFKNIKLQIGSSLIPLMEAFAGFVTDIFALFHALPQGFKDILSWAFSFAVILPVIITGLKLFTAGMTAAKLALATMSVVAKGASFSFAMLAESIGLIAVQMAVFIAGFYAALIVFDDIMWFIRSGFKIGKESKSLIGHMIGGISQFAQWCLDGLQAFADKFMAIWYSIEKRITGIIDGITEKIRKLLGLSEGISSNSFINNAMKDPSNVSPTNSPKGLSPAATITGTTIVLNVSGIDNPLQLTKMLGDTLQKEWNAQIVALKGMTPAQYKEATGQVEP